jgi:hypothetical protein
VFHHPRLCLLIIQSNSWSKSEPGSTLKCCADLPRLESLLMLLAWTKKLEPPAHFGRRRESANGREEDAVGEPEVESGGCDITDVDGVRDSSGSDPDNRRPFFSQRSKNSGQFHGSQASGNTGPSGLTRTTPVCVNETSIPEARLVPSLNLTYWPSPLARTQGPSKVVLDTWLGIPGASFNTSEATTK